MVTKSTKVVQQNAYRNIEHRTDHQAHPLSDQGHHVANQAEGDEPGNPKRHPHHEEHDGTEDHVQSHLHWEFRHC